MANEFIASLESGALTGANGFDSTSGTGLSVVAPGLVSSLWCMRVNITDATDRYGQSSSAGDLSQARLIVAIDPEDVEGLTMADGDLFTIILAQDNGSVNDVFRVELGYTTANGYRLRPGIRTDAAAWSDGSWINVTANEHLLEVEWNQSSGADDGSIELWIDVYGSGFDDTFGAADSSVTGIDNDTLDARVFRFGAPDGVDAGTSGVLLVDHIVVNNDTGEIGHPGSLAFPGAEGAGRFTTGGRGGTIYLVTNTNNTGAGSLRAACEASGARTIVFNIDGTITLASDITISDPYITISGQTAPEGGIQLRDYTFRIQTHDVIIQHVRFRPGDTNPTDNRDAVQLNSSPANMTDSDAMVFNVILDHCSMSWSVDGVIDFFNDFPARSNIKNCTVQWCIISEALSNAGHTEGNHSTAMIMGGNAGSGGKNFSLLYTIFAHNRRRSPRFSFSWVEIIGCWVHDIDTSAHFCIRLDELAEYVNIVGCYQTGDGSAGGNGFIMVEPNIQTTNPADYGSHQLYLSDNLGYNSAGVTQWLSTGVVWKGFGTAQWATSGFQTAWEAGSAHFIPQSNISNKITPSARTTIVNFLPGSCGALFARDTTDERIIREVLIGTSNIPDSQDDVGGWPTLPTGSSGTDTDADGMPDTWEDASGTDSGVADSDLFTNDFWDDFSNIEAYYHSLIGPAIVVVII